MAKFKNKKWWKAMGIRAWKTFYQSILAGGIGALITDEKSIALLTASLTAIFSCINSAIVSLPEVGDSVTPEIDDEEIIDTIEEDEELEGNKIEELIIGGE